MTSSLVGSEMCIRDRVACGDRLAEPVREPGAPGNALEHHLEHLLTIYSCLLYTSDAADDM
eukprot:956741-Prorocentrum_lima.AAC.1